MNEYAEVDAAIRFLEWLWGHSPMAVAIFGAIAMHYGASIYRSYCIKHGKNTRAFSGGVSQADFALLKQENHDDHERLGAKGEANHAELKQELATLREQHKTQRELIEKIGSNVSNLREKMGKLEGMMEAGGRNPCP